MSRAHVAFARVANSLSAVSAAGAVVAGCCALSALARSPRARERSEKAIAPARALLEAAGLAYREHRHVGSPGSTIARVVQEQNCDLIVIGTRGLGTYTGALLGSVAQATLDHSSVPVLVVH